MAIQQTVTKSSGRESARSSPVMLATAKKSNVIGNSHVRGASLATGPIDVSTKIPLQISLMIAIR
jgi:hypothetical protein